MKGTSLKRQGKIRNAATPRDFREISDLDLNQDDRKPNILQFKSIKYFSIFAFPSVLCPVALILNKVP